MYITLADPPDATGTGVGAPMVGCATIANRRRLRVLAQCKAERKKMGPAYLRELEGVVSKYAAAGMILSESSRVPIADDDPNYTPPTTTSSKDLSPPPIALLVSESAFTRHCLIAAHASPLPFLLVHLPPLAPPPSSSKRSGNSGVDGTIGAIFGNPALISPKGVFGGELEIRWERGGSGVPPSSSSQSSWGGAGRPRLWWQGRPLPSWTPEAGAVADVESDGR